MAQLRGTKRKFQEGLFSNYCGLGGSGIPQHEADSICMEHDINYGTIQAMGFNPYLSWNWADERMVTQVSELVGQSPKEKVVLVGVRAFLTAKKAGFPEGEMRDQSYVTAPSETTPQKRPREGFQEISPDMKRVKKNPSLRDLPVEAQAIMPDVEMGMAPRSAARNVHENSAERGNGSGETPLSNVPPTYGLPDTVNAVLPMVMFYSQTMSGAYTSDAAVTRIRMNSMFDNFVDTLTAPVAGAAYTVNRWSAKIADNTVEISTAPNNIWPTPVQLWPLTGSGSSEKAQWRDWYNKLYDFYHVMGVDYEVTVMNPTRISGRDVLVGIGFDSSSASNTAGSYPTAPVTDMRNWSGLQWKTIGAGGDGTMDEQYAKFTGHYTPGQINRVIENDEDVKTWTSTGSSTTPTLTEFMKIYVGRPDFSTQTASTYIGVNVRVKLRFIVQYKQLKSTFRYPSAGASAVTLTAPTDVVWSA